MKVFNVLSRKVEIRNQSGFQNRSCCGYRKDLVLRKYLMWTSWISALLWCLLEAFLPAEVCWVTEGSALLLPSLALLQAPCGSVCAVGRGFAPLTSPLPRCLALRQLPNWAQEGNSFGSEWQGCAWFPGMLLAAALTLHVSLGVQGVNSLLLCVLYDSSTLQTKIQASHWTA